MDGTILVTGTATGIGLNAVKNLLSRPDAKSFAYIFTVRSTNSSSLEPLQALVDNFNNQEKDHKADIRRIDLASQISVREFASQLNSDISTQKLPPIRALILNAAIHVVTGYTNRPASDENDVELHFQVNFLSNLLLSLLLLQSMDKKSGRIVYLGSWAHDPAVPMNSWHKPSAVQWKDDACEQIALAGKMPPGDQYEKDVAGQRRYGSSKLWLLMGMAILQKKLAADPQFQNISVVGVDPGGVVSTSIMRHAGSGLKIMVLPVKWYVQTVGKYISPNGMWRTEAKSAQDVINGALDAKPIGKDPHDLYLNGSEVGKRSPETLDAEKQEKLWKASLGFANIRQEETVLKL